MNDLRSSASKLIDLLPHYQPRSSSDERARFFGGLLAKAADSLIAIDTLQTIGAVWPLHCRWIIEAVGVASALNQDAAVIDQIKRGGANTFLLVADTVKTERKRICNSM